MIERILLSYDCNITISIGTVRLLTYFIVT